MGKSCRLGSLTSVNVSLNFIREMIVRFCTNKKTFSIQI